MAPRTAASNRVFAAFWHLTAGAWMRHLPIRRYLREMLRCYLVGIFQNEPHPTRKTELSKLNPLQRITYAVFVIAHVYLTTTGHTVSANLKAMIAGWEPLDKA